MSTPQEMAEVVLARLKEQLTEEEILAAVMEFLKALEAEK